MSIPPNKSGFSLIEICVAVMLLGTFITVLVPASLTYFNLAARSRTLTSAKQILRSMADHFAYDDNTGDLFKETGGNFVQVPGAYTIYTTHDNNVQMIPATVWRRVETLQGPPTDPTAPRLLGATFRVTYSYRGRTFTRELSTNRFTDN